MSHSAPSAAPRWQSLKANAAATLAARLLTPALSLLLVIVIARLRGAAGLGQYTLLITIFVLCENIKSLGLPSFAVREIATHGPDAYSYYHGLIRIGLAGAAITAPLMVAGLAFAGGHSAEFLWASAVLSLGLFPSAFALAGDALFLGIGRATYTLWVSSAENTLRLVASLATVLLFHGGLIALAGVYAVTRTLAAVAQLWLTRRVLHITSQEASASRVREILRRVPSFFLIFIAPLALLRMDILILGALRGDAEVGIYSAAMRLLTVCLIVPDAIMSASFAVLSKLSGPDTAGEFTALVRKTVIWLGAALMPIAASLALLASFGTSLLFGSKFAGAVLPAQTLSWALVPFAVNRAVGDAMIARQRQRTVAAIVGVNFALSGALYYFLIRAWGVEGAAWAFYLSVLLFCGMSVFYAVRRAAIHVEWPLVFALLPALFCSLVFATVPNATIRVIACCLAIATAVVPALSSLNAGKAAAAVSSCSSVSVEVQ